MTAEQRHFTAKFTPSIYDVGSMDEAKAVILSPFADMTVEHRWQTETPYLGGLIEKHLGITKDSLVLDYGCGVGRLSSEIIKRTGCMGVGVDYSTNMRAFAANYTDTPNFMACDALFLPEFEGKFDAAFTVWVLQHCLHPLDNIKQIWYSLKPNGKFFVVNDIRFIPTDLGFVCDQTDVTALLNENFELLEQIELAPSVFGPELTPRAYCAVYQK